MKVLETPTRDVLRLFMWYPLRWLICSLPVAKAITLLRFMGDMHYYSSRKKCSDLKKKINKLVPRIKDASFAVQTYFRNHYLDQLFILIFPNMKMGDINKFVEIEGLDNLEKCREQQNGVILVHGHFGPAHLPLVVLGLLGYPMNQIGNPTDAGLSWIGKNVAYRLRMRYESMMPAKIIKVNEFLRPIFRALKKNELIMTAGDGSGTDDEFGQHHEYFFLGQIRRMPIGPAILSVKTGSALLPLFVLPGQKKMYRIIIGEQLTAPPGAENREIMITQKFLNKYENFVLRYPGYMHFLDRFSV